MRKFKVYPKEKGEPFDIELERFEYNKTGFILYDAADQPSRDGYAALENIAAILPEPLADPPTNRSYVPFSVYLKGREGKPIVIAAHKVDCDSEPSLVFFWEQWGDENRLVPHQIPNIFISRSEVTAVIPKDGLKGKDDRRTTVF